LDKIQYNVVIEFKFGIIDNNMIRINMTAVLMALERCRFLEENTLESGGFIEVPQGFYAEITKDTPEDIKGMYTDSLEPCACLVVTNKDRTHMFLAHMDGPAFNVGDPVRGLPAWIDKMKSGGTDESDIEIHYSNGNGYGMEEYYGEVLNKIKSEYGGVKLEMHNITSCPSAGVILRNNSDLAVIEKFEDSISDECKILGEKPYINSGVLYNLNGDPIGGVQDFLETSHNNIYSQDDRWRNEGIGDEEYLEDHTTMRYG
jgi:hypothetical protein